MSTPFLTPQPSMKPSETIDSPFLRAKQEWDLRMGSSIIQARNWRFAFVLAMVCSGLLGALNILQLSKANVIPVLVGLDKETGEPTVVGPAPSKQYKPGPLETKYFLSQFIRFVRSVPTDSVVIKQNWLRAYSFLRKDAASLLNEMTNKDEESPLKKIGKIIVSIQPISVVQIPDTDSFQVRWKETTYSSTGNKIEDYTMLGTFLIEIDPPKDEQTLKENPLGLFIKNFQWNREL
jgi:type IV secretion system protein TrbF